MLAQGRGGQQSARGTAVLCLALSLGFIIPVNDAGAGAARRTPGSTRHDDGQTRSGLHRVQGSRSVSGFRGTWTINYSVSGVALTEESETGNYRGYIDGDTITVTATTIGQGYVVNAQLRVDDEVARYEDDGRSTARAGSRKSVNLSLPVPSPDSRVTFRISMFGRDRAQRQSVGVGGGFHGRPPVDAGPARTPPSAPSDTSDPAAPPGDRSGIIGSLFGGLARIPLPANAGQAAAGLLIPGLIAVILDILGRRGAASAAAVAGLDISGSARTDEDIVDDPRPGDRVTDVDGVDWIYAPSAIDGSGRPGWQTVADYEKEQSHLEQGHIFEDGTWWRPEDYRQRQGALNEQRRQADEHFEQRAREGEAFRRREEAEDQLLDHLQQVRRTAANRGMIGGIDDTHGRVSDIISDLVEGKPLDVDRITRVRDHVVGRITGRTLGPRDLPAPQVPAWADLGSLGEAMVETGREITTGRNSDGSTSWRGVGGRIAIGALTGGASEWVCVPVGSTYTIKDAIDRGESGLMATARGIGQALIQDLIGRGVGSTLRAGRAAIRGGGNAAVSGGSAIQGSVSGGWRSLRTDFSGVGGLRQQGAELLSRKGWQATGQNLGTKLTNGVSRVDNILTGREGLNRMPPTLSAAEQARADLFTRAVNSGDPKRVCQLYRNGGMRQLEQLQRKGAIRPDVARKANQMLQREVNDAVRKGTRDLIENHNTHGVRIEEVIVADSGSSSGGKLTRLGSDFDRTMIPRFNDAQLQRYAQRNGLSPQQAYDRLSRQFADNQSRSVDHFLQRKGLRAADVDYGAYDRIGAGAGPADSYAQGFTNARQSVGSAEVYRTNVDGTVRNPYRTSGHSAVDANQLNNARYGTGSLPQDPVAFTRAEVPSVVRQQLNSVTNKAGDPVAIAKAVGRAEKGANILEQSLGDSDLLQAASEIYSNPGSLDDVLTNYGFNSIEEFCEAGGKAVSELAGTLEIRR